MSLQTKISPEILWHYTSIPTAVKIIQTRTLRASHCQFLNDCKEWVFGVDRVTKALDSLCKSNRSGNNFGGSLDIMQAKQRVGHSDYYLISFCEEGDTLALWRGYCPDRGCAIGFNRQKLEAFFQNKSWRFGKCIYEDENLQDILRADLDQDNRSIPYIQKLWDISILIKNSTFQEEKEWRAYISNSPLNDSIPYPILFETPKPQIAIEIPEVDFLDIIQEIRLAPHSSNEINMRYLELLKKQLLVEYRARLQKELRPIDIFEVSQSQIPYRK